MYGSMACNALLVLYTHHHHLALKHFCQPQRTPCPHNSHPHCSFPPNFSTAISLYSVSSLRVPRCFMEMESCNIWPAVSGFFLVLTSYFHSLSICSMGQHSIAFCGRVMFHGRGSATFCLWVAAAVSSASEHWCHGSLLPVCFL